MPNFAMWAYVDYYSPDAVAANLAGRGFMTYAPSDVPGRVGHYVALSEEENVLLIGVKGTSTLEDLLMDAAGKVTVIEGVTDLIEVDGELPGVPAWLERSRATYEELEGAGTASSFYISPARETADVRTARAADLVRSMAGWPAPLPHRSDQVQLRKGRRRHGTTCPRPHRNGRDDRRNE